MQAGTGRARIAAIGDSLTAGWGSGVLSGTGSGSGATAGDSPNVKRAKSLPSLMAARFTANGINARADALFGNAMTGSTASDANSYNPNLTLGTGWSMDASTLSLGGKAFKSTSPATGSLAFTPEFEANRFDIYYVIKPGGGTFTVTDASGTLLTVNTDGVEGFGRQQVIRSGSSTTPISIQRNGTGGDIWLVGIVPYSTTAPRLEIFNMGAAGWKASDWISSTSPWNPGNALTNVLTDLWTIQLGTNDYFAGVSAATFKTQINTLAGITQFLPTDLWLIKTHLNTNSSYNTPASYRTALDELTTSLNLPTAMDFYSGVSLVTADRYDGVHLSENGYTKEAIYEHDLIKAKVT